MSQEQELDPGAVRLDGELDVSTIVPTRERLYREIDAHPGGTVRITLDDLTFIDSSGLGLLVAALKRARLAGGDLSFSRPTENLWRVFTITGLDRALPFDG